MPIPFICFLSIPFQFPSFLIMLTTSEMMWEKPLGEAIYATRPWTQAEDGNIRFTRSKDNQTLYAICLEKPANNNLVIPVLNGSKMKVNSIQLLGYEGTIKWKQKDDGLYIVLPKILPCDFAWSFKIK